MTQLIQTDFQTTAAFTLTTGALAANGGGRASASRTNSAGHQFAYISGVIQTNTAPTAGTLYKVYLLMIDDQGTDYGTDGWTGADEAITIRDAPEIASIRVTASATTLFEFFTTTKRAIDRLPAEWGIAVVNWTDVAGNSSGNVFRFREANDELQAVV